MGLDKNFSTCIKNFVEKEGAEALNNDALLSGCGDGNYNQELSVLKRVLELKYPQKWIRESKDIARTKAFVAGRLEREEHLSREDSIGIVDLLEFVLRGPEVSLRESMTLTEPRDPVVPPIPRVVQNHNFTPADIKWVKNVNDGGNYNQTRNSAYLPPDYRVIKNENGVFFCLQLNQELAGCTASLNRVDYGDLILLYQRLDNQSTKCFTHLVTPIGKEVVHCPYGPPHNGWDGRWVRVIAMTGNTAIRSINSERTAWATSKLPETYKRLTWQQGRVYEISQNTPGLYEVQQDIWRRFNAPFIVSHGYNAGGLGV